MTKIINAPPVVMRGCTASAAGQAGYPPAPAAGDQEKVLTGRGTWRAFDSLEGNVGTERVSQIYGMGDSLTANGTYLAKLVALLGNEWNAVNCGIGGNLASEMETRFANDVLLGGDANTVIIWAGINSVSADDSAATIQGNLQAMYTAAAAAGATVVAVLITPFKTSTAWSAPRQAVADAVNAWIAATATDVDFVVDAYALLEDPGAADTLLAAYDSGDHLHLSTAGYEAVGTAIHEEVTWVEDEDVPTVSAAGQGAKLNQDVSTGGAPAFNGINVARNMLRVDRTTRKLGINTSSPEAKVDIVGDAANAAGIHRVTQAVATNSPTQIIRQTVAGGVADADQGQVIDVVGHDEGVAWHVKNNGTSRTFVRNNGEMVHKGPVNLSHASAGQIKFPATQNPAADANTLDDYEEGTWEAAFVSGGGTVTINNSFKTGAYVKIGKVVTVTGFFAVSAVSSPTGSLSITGLPFTSGAGNQFISPAVVWANSLTSGATTAMQGRVTGSSNAISLGRFAAGDNNDIAANMQAGSQIAVSLTYIAAA